MYKCNICVVNLVGIPGAGKTTFSNILKDFSSEFQFKIFNYDELCIDFSSSSRKEVFNSIGNIISIINNNSNNNNNNEKPTYFIIIIDDNMYYKSMRNQYLSLCKTFGIGFLQVYFAVTLEKALHRNNSRDEVSKVPDSIILKMHDLMEVPTTDVFVINSDLEYNSYLVNDFFDHIRFALDNCKAVLKLNKPEPLPMSKLQKADLILRKLVNVKVSQNKRSAEKYNIIKKVVFYRMKNGNIIISLLSDNELFELINSFFNI